MHTMSATPFVVVTGGAGFIGSHTVDRLIERGCNVAVLDNFSTGKRENLSQWAGKESLEILTVDIGDGIFAALADLEERWGKVERIVHLAAQTSVVHSIENPLNDVRNNYTGTVQVLEYARRKAVCRVVFASSAAVYGDVDTFPVSEDATCTPLSPYGIDKLGSEYWLRYHTSVFGMDTQPLRFFNVYGPRQDPSSPYTGVISIFSDRAAAGKELRIFGDGEQTRDFVYVGDVSRAILLALFAEGGDGNAANVGTGAETSVNELAALINEFCGGKSSISHAEPRDGEILKSVADVSRARERFGFEAETKLPDGLKETVASLQA
ncbi:MAG: SDR family NAD(P)-dependent oxidoreductase [Myxococcales bacterium]|nr:SDR family NAD(P)-dependent oxidoreductase [Myxococcales bacterium]